ncbi:MAG: type I restriction-modification system subunit M [Roseomonas sp.]|nr:type I restriction-modification system subunit M [Roseomonas sp.]
MSDTNTLSLDELKRRLWAACDTFRGVLDPSEYKDFILVMLFLKYVSDVWEAHAAEARARYGEDEERVRRRLERERFFLPADATFGTLYAARDTDNIGERINVALQAIEDTNRAKLEGVFRGVDFNSESKLGATRERNRRLKMLLEDFHSLDLSPDRVSEDALGEGYIYLVERFASDAGKKAGEFYTPSQVSKLLARLVDPQPGARIYDPTCGSGSLLLRAAEVVEAKGSRDFSLWGQEVNGATWSLARLNMFLHGRDGARLEWGDTLNEPKLVEGNALLKFGAVLANPPFSLDKWGAERAGEDRFGRYARGVPPKSKADYAFILHMIESALPQVGRIGVIAPHGVLFRGGAEGRIRRTLIEENLLDAVVGLPAQLFPSTGIPVAMLIFDRARERGGARAEANDVMFVDSSRDFRPGRRQNVLEEAHMDRIVATVQARAAVERYARPVPITEIAENDFNLNIPRYVSSAEATEAVDLAAVEADIQRLEAELAEVRAKMKQHLRELGVV